MGRIFLLAAAVALFFGVVQTRAQSVFVSTLKGAPTKASVLSLAMTLLRIFRS